MVEIKDAIRKKNLWLKVIDGNMESILRSGRFREIITIYPHLRLIGISKGLLKTGVFVGRWKCCPIQLKELSVDYPQLCMRFNPENEWNAFTTSPHVTVNGHPLTEFGYLLDFEDRIQVENYVFEVVPKPMLKNELSEASAEIDKLLSLNEDVEGIPSEKSKESTDYDLRLR